MPDTLSLVSQTSNTNKIGPGTLVLVVGPSGAGKDTVIDGLKQQVAGDPRFQFARRIITRDADASSEDHDTLCHDRMQALIASGRAPLHWHAHGLTYALPEDTTQHIKNGGVCIANGSRKAISSAQERFAHVVIVHITAPLLVLAQRLAQRGRESQSDIEQRLQRADLSLPACDHLIEINNIDSPEVAVRKLQSELLLYL